ncbi:MAG: hypothetical protein V3U46_08760 [Acidimicrobiia bacterium]
MRLRMILTVLVLSGLVAAGGVYYFWNGRPRPADVTHAQLVNSRGDHLEVFVSACNADLSAEIRETDQAVGVLVTKRHEWDADCGGGLAISLTEPLGGRVLIDLSDWKVIEVP